MIESLLIFLLFLAPTIRYRAELGAFSIALMEPATLALCGSLIWRALASKRAIHLPGSPLLGIWLLALVWVVAVSPLKQDWQHALSDVRDWAIPLFTLFVLLTFIHTGWRKWTLMLLWIGVIQSVIGIYQMATDSFRPLASATAIYKLSFLPGAGRVSSALGLFEHPNSLATFLIVAWMVGLGWLAEPGQRWKKVLVLVILAPALYWTYSKAQILALALMMVIFLFSQWTRSTILWATGSIGLSLLAVIVAFIVVQTFPGLFGTIYWRIGLWDTARQVIAAQPQILLVGNGDMLFATQAIWPQPHNLFYQLLLSYGLPMVLLVGLLGVLWWLEGIQSHLQGFFHRSPLLASTWVALLGFFITGLVESAMIGIETRMLIVLVIACTLGLKRELKA